MAQAPMLLFFALTVCAACASATAFAPFAAPDFYPAQEHVSAHDFIPQYPAMPHGMSDPSFSVPSHLFNFCLNRGYKMPGTKAFVAACIAGGFVSPSKKRSEAYCHAHGYVKPPPHPVPCSKSKTCGCHRRHCWQSCGKDALSHKKRHGDWCWSSYIPGKDNWLRCRADDECSVLPTTCGGKCS